MTDLEIKIIEARKEGLSYGTIQLRLGNPSKRFIKDTLLKYDSTLLGDVMKNYNKLQIKY